MVRQSTGALERVGRNGGRTLRGLACRRIRRARAALMVWNRDVAERVRVEAERFRKRLNGKPCPHPGDAATRTLLQISHPDDGALWAVRCVVCEHVSLECGMPRERRK